jgi:hypothetical protein
MPVQCDPKIVLNVLRISSPIDCRDLWHPGMTVSGAHEAIKCDPRVIRERALRALHPVDGVDCTDRYVAGMTAAVARQTYWTDPRVVAHHAARELAVMSSYGVPSNKRRRPEP